MSNETNPIDLTDAAGRAGVSDYDASKGVRHPELGFRDSLILTALEHGGGLPDDTHAGELDIRTSRINGKVVEETDHTPVGDDMTLEEAEQVLAEQDKRTRTEIDEQSLAVERAKAVVENIPDDPTPEEIAAGAALSDELTAVKKPIAPNVPTDVIGKSLLGTPAVPNILDRDKRIKEIGDGFKPRPSDQ